MTFQLTDIRQTIRNVTSSPSVYQLTDAVIDDYINKYYLYVLPDDMKPYRLLVPYVFETLQNQVKYSFDQNTYISLEPEVFCNGNRLFYYQDQSVWLRDYQYQYNQSQVGTGDGLNTAFLFTAGSPPIVPGTIIVTDGVENFTDPLEDGILVGTLGGVGTVNYTTGDVSVSFNTAPASGVAINLTYAPLINGRPRAMYFDPGMGSDGNATIQFSPIPDQSYRIECQAWMMPTAFIAGGSGTQTPNLDHWGYAIAYGAALEIFRQRGQLDQLALYRPEYEYYLDRAQSRTTQQLSNQRTLPKW